MKTLTWATIVWTTVMADYAVASTITPAYERQWHEVTIPQLKALAEERQAPRLSLFKFDAEVLNKIGEAARLKYESMSAELGEDKLKELAKQQFAVADKGHLEEKDLLAGFRFESITRNVREGMQAVFAGRILDKPQRVVNNVGGVFAVLEVYYCSATEYIAMFGSPLHQEGFSGAYPMMDVYDIMVDGVMHSHGFDSNDSAVKTYGAQDISLLRKTERRFYDMEANTLMIDYGRGFVIPAFWQGVIAPAIFSNQDYQSFFGHVGDCARSVLQHRTLFF